MYVHRLHRGRKHFGYYTGKVLKSHINDCFEINGKQVIKWLCLNHHLWSMPILEVF